MWKCVRIFVIKSLSHHSSKPQNNSFFVLLIVSRWARGRNSSPFSTCRSTRGAFCRPWSRPYWEVSVCTRDVRPHNSVRGPPCEWRRFSPAGDVQCFGGDCYALAFGVPAVLMIVALGEFSSSSRTFALKQTTLRHLHRSMSDAGWGE